MKNIIKLLRPHHIIKNILVFLPLIFSGRLLETDSFLTALLGFLSFGFLSSAIYAINDIADCEKDRLHPTKCQRPVASGRISKSCAAIVAAVLVVLSLATDLLVSENRLSFAAQAVYFVLNLSYSFGLKAVPLVDIVILVSGFLLRVLYGSFITDIPVSNWLYLTVISISFYLGLGKRRGEKSRSGTDTRSVLKHYTYEFLDKNMYIANALTLIFYALWCTCPEITDRFSNRMLWTVPLVMVISLKYSLNIEGSSDGDPVEIIIRDKPLIVLTVLYSITLFSVLYLL